MNRMLVVRAFWSWALKRGILYGLISTPLLSLLIGYFFRWTSSLTAAFVVMGAFAALPVWVAYRKSQSDDPDEPVHHLPRYALSALVPFVVYDLARIPMYYLFQMAFWARWFDFGSELTAQPPDQWSSFISGMFVHVLQGYTLALGFYVLYKRHSLINAIAYVGLFLSILYIWTFPTFVAADYQPPAQWFATVFWSHGWMALATWIVPQCLFAPMPWSRLRGGVIRWLAVPAVALIYVSPYALAAALTASWQFPAQDAIEQAAFDHAQVVLQNQPALDSVESVPGAPALQEAHYKFDLRFGPRSYRDSLKALKALDANAVRVNGWLVHQSEIVAWCSAYIPELDSPNSIKSPVEYFAAIRRMEFSDIPVACAGPAAATRRLATAGSQPQIDLHWTANMSLSGERERQERSFEGDDTDLPLTVGGALAGLRRLAGGH